jgi:hypothetical protein
MIKSLYLGKLKIKIMKKIYILLMAIAFGGTVNAQFDIAVSLNNFTSGDATSADPLDMVFTITNNSGADVPVGDTIFFAYLIGTSNYSMSLQSGGVSYIGPLTVAWPSGASDAIDLSMLTTPPSTMDMQWIYAEFGNQLNPGPIGGVLDGNICAFACVGEDGLSLNANNDANYIDNYGCVDYTVTAVTGVDENDITTINAYPNPATNQINFDLGNNQMDKILVLDITGRVVDNIAVTSKIETLPLSDYENGVYFYQMVRGDEIIKTDKFVVSK